MDNGLAAAVGIEDLSFYVPSTFVALEEIADVRGVEYAKFRDGIGQEKMAILPPDEDIVTMAAHAAAPIVELASVRERLTAVIVATESGVDASKASAMFVHGLLDLPSTCMAWDVQQACAGSTAAIIQATAMVRSAPGTAILVIASDVAAYELGSPAEPTQGAGACAMLISNQPRIAEIDGDWYAHSADVNDFWRPPQRECALVDGRLSVATYLGALKACREQMPQAPGTWERALFHLPFTRIAAKSAKVLDLPQVAWQSGTIYGRKVGNTYAASLYIALASLLEQDETELDCAKIGMFAYGSGAMGILFEITVAPGYRQHLRTSQHEAMLNNRHQISVETYEEWRNLASVGESVPDPGIISSPSKYRFAGVNSWARHYECIPQDHLFADSTQATCSNPEDPSRSVYIR